MFSSRLLGVPLRSTCRVAFSRSLCRRGLNHQGMQFRSYSGSKIPRDKTNVTVVDESLSSWSLKDFIIPPAVLLVLGAGIWFIHKNDERRATTGLNKVKRFERNPEGIWPYGGPFRLVNTENELVTEADLLGGWILMLFGYTSSPDVGPEEVQKMAEIIDILDHQHNLKITPVFISIDPQRDSPAQLRAYLRVRQIAQEFRVFFKKVEEEGQDYLIESTNDMILLNPKMEIVGRFGVRYDAEQLSYAVLKEVKKAAK
uniref:Protein SCO1 2, mitochondrial n=1 Tax=Anthurium amnicola TaxID=1678845 RepID=A0A1D1YT57_9ARAE